MSVREQWSVVLSIALLVVGFALTGWLTDLTWPQRLGVLALMASASLTGGWMSTARTGRP